MATSKGYTSEAKMASVLSIQVDQVKVNKAKASSMSGRATMVQGMIVVSMSEPL